MFHSLVAVAQCGCLPSMVAVGSMAGSDCVGSAGITKELELGKANESS